MESDRELLELAAKAAGYPDEWKGRVKIVCDAPVYERDWNPINDDGDALRLVIKLNIELFVGDRAVTAIGEYRSHSKIIGHDKNADVRLVIVRAAASIGRRMKDADKERK